MIAIGSREAVVQNLENAGCEPELIRDFLEWFDRGSRRNNGNCWNSRENIC